MSDFHRRLEEQIPRLRRYARALTRDASRADDLVQDTLLRALAKQHLWQDGTNLRAWLFTLMHNQHVNDVRRSNRDGGNIDVTEMASVLVANTDPTASRQLRELERGSRAPADGAARGDPARRARRPALRRGGRDRGRTDRHRALAPVARPRGAAAHSRHRGGTRRCPRRRRNSTTPAFSVRPRRAPGQCPPADKAQPPRCARRPERPHQGRSHCTKAQSYTTDGSDLVRSAALF